MGYNDFATRSETFGFENESRWGFDAIRLLFNSPRCYEPLLESWDRTYPGSKKAFQKLLDQGFLEYQKGLIVNTISGELRQSESKAVTRWILSSKGQKLLTHALIDSRVLDDTFKHLTPRNNQGLLFLLELLNLKGSHAKYGVSGNYLSSHSTLPDRTTRYWVKKLSDEGYAKILDSKYPDTREIIPAHWRVNKKITKQLLEVLKAFPEVKVELQRLRLLRNKYLGDIDPARVGVTGDTDYDHDIEVQKIMATFLLSSMFDTGSDIQIEPRNTLNIDTAKTPWEFNVHGGYNIFYQPDSSFKEFHNNIRYHTVLEYERYQSRKDAWTHIEKFIGLVNSENLAFEPAILRFVVDSKSRVRSYVKLIEAFADYALDHPERMPKCDITLAVCSTESVYNCDDALDFKHWYRVQIVRSETESRVVLHDSKDSPYRNYFSELDDTEGGGE